MSSITIIINEDCEKKEDEFIEYIIPEGEHYSTNNRPTKVETKNYRFQVCFDKSAKYTVAPEDQHDINKLTGFSDNRSLHQQFSARFGWRWSDDALRLFAYVYNYGDWQEAELSVIEIGQIYTCKITVDEDEYIFSIKELPVDVRMTRASLGGKAEGYRLYPYFGGNSVAPHEVKIWLKYL